MLTSPTGPLILGSRSPRRQELLSLLFPSAEIRIVPPPDEHEPGFTDCRSFEEVLTQLQTIARIKGDSVQSELGNAPWGALLTADTEVIVEAGDGITEVLGKPDGPGWEGRVRDWFRNFYCGREHHVATAVCLRLPDGRLKELVEVTQVRFRPLRDDLLEWYLRTEEPLGKAGGYGIQGAGGMFLESLQGSLSNVIGLPLEPVWAALRDWNFL